MLYKGVHARKKRGLVKLFCDLASFFYYDQGWRSWLGASFIHNMDAKHFQYGLRHMEGEIFKEDVRVFLLQYLKLTFI